MNSDKIDIHINIGSNSGHRKALIERAVAAISASFHGEIRVSDFIETEPWGFDSPHRFLNVGVMVRTTVGTLFKASASCKNHPANPSNDTTKEPHWHNPSSNADALKSVPTVYSREEIAIAILDRLLEIQHTIDPSPHRGPDGSYIDRAIDIDLIAIADWVITALRLTLPHPRMHLRDFVLRPMAQLAPAWLHPLIGKTPAELARDIEARELH